MEDTRPKRAIALEYDGANAPRISAMGDDALARRIIEIAREHGIPLLENDELAGLLSQLDLGDEIPETLYLCVAQIIAFAYRLRGRVPQGHAAEDGDIPHREPRTGMEVPTLPPALS